ncbi:hypothetical protein [Pseudoalteromonas ruthenica]|uniref:hypothetical protein n=1 Tax=Pseudoalteromonas ruthenica TaxID=151081 RepID=UPI00047597B9|nr:hypothetical protein [Pseudoalteromonas ruthenica]
MSSSLPNLFSKNNAKLALNKIPAMLDAHSNNNSDDAYLRQISALFCVNIGYQRLVTEQFL